MELKVCLRTRPGRLRNSGNSKVGIAFTDQAYNGFTNQSINGGISSVGTSAYNGNSLIDNTYSYIDNLTWQRGKHYLSMGIEALRYQNNYPTGNNDGYLGSLNYTGAFTANLLRRMPAGTAAPTLFWTVCSRPV